jgi:molecular chaperone GrpE
MKRKSKVREPRKTSVEDLKNQLARALADYDNLRKRVEREREEFGKLANLRLVARLLPVSDMLEGAQKHLRDSGLAITIEEFIKVLKEEGIEKINAKQGDTFDEDVHEAVEVADPQGSGKGKDGKVVKVILSGWKIIDGPVIRPVKVKVYRK